MSVRPAASLASDDFGSVDPLALARRIAGFGLTRPSPPQAIQPSAWRASLATLRSQRLTGLATAASEVGELRLDPRQSSELLEIQRAAMVQALSLERHLLDLANRFARRDVDVIVLKGPAVARSFYPEPAQRPFGDLDLLVRTRDWRTACAILAEAGFRRQIPEPSRGFDERFGKAATHVGSDGVQVDLHRTLALGPFGLWLDADGLFERTTSFPLGDLRLSRLDDTAAMLHACIHAVLGSRRPRLLPLRDVAQIATAGDVDWVDLDALAERSHLRAVVSRALDDASRYLAWPVPATAQRVADRPTGRLERRALAAYTTTRRERGGTALSTLLAIHGPRRKAAYVRALLLPDREFLEARVHHAGAIGYARRWLVPLRWLTSRRGPRMRPVVGPRVLHVVATGERRGAEIFASDLVRALARSDISQRVVVLRGGATAVPYEAPVRFLRREPVIGGGGIELGRARALRRLVRSWRPHVVQAHGGEALKYSVLATLGTTARVVYRRIGSAHPKVNDVLRRATYGWLMRRAILVVAVSEAVRAETARVFGLALDRTVTIPNAVDPERVRAIRDRSQIRRGIGADPSAPLVVSVAAFTWEKDPRTLLEVAATVFRQVDDASWILVGDGPLRGEVEAAARATGLDGRMRFLGPRDDVGDLLAVADLLVLSSRTEGMPAALIEAGLAGLPVAAFDIAGVSEIVVDGVTGLLAPPGDVGTLARHVMRLLRDPVLRRAMGSAGAERCAALFDIRSYAPRYAQLYRALAGVSAVPEPSVK